MSVHALLWCQHTSGFWKPEAAGTWPGKISLHQKAWKRIGARESTGPRQTLADCCCIEAVPAGQLQSGKAKAPLDLQRETLTAAWAEQHWDLPVGAHSSLRSGWENKWGQMKGGLWLVDTPSEWNHYQASQLYSSQTILIQLCGQAHSHLFECLKRRHFQSWKVQPRVDSYKGQCLKPASRCMTDIITFATYHQTWRPNIFALIISRNASTRACPTNLGILTVPQS